MSCECDVTPGLTLGNDRKKSQAHPSTLRIGRYANDLNIQGICLTCARKRDAEADVDLLNLSEEHETIGHRRDVGPH